MFGFGNNSKPQGNQQPANNQQQQNNQGNQGNQGQPNNGKPNPNGTQGNNQNQQGNNQNTQSNEPVNPLDAYGKMFDNPTNTEAAPSFSLDPKVMDQVVSSQDFMQGIEPELLQKATSGDMQALLQVISQSNRNAYRASIEHGGVLTDKFVSAREGHSSKGLPGRIKQELTSSALAKTPNFQHPVVKKQLTEIASRLSQQHPDASAEEIATMSKDYITQLSQALNPEDKTKQGASGNQSEERGEEYWNEFFEADSKQTP